jgi:hypothetical protein
VIYDYFRKVVIFQPFTVQMQRGARSLHTSAIIPPVGTYARKYAEDIQAKR